MFADDCCISCSIPRTELNFAHMPINTGLKRVSKWLSSNKIKINSTKTNYMIFSYRDRNQLNEPIMIGSDRIGQVDNVNFLGVVLDDRLRFSHHVSLLSSKISRSVGVLFKIRTSVPDTILKSLTIQ